MTGQHGGVWCPQSAGQELQPLLLHKLEIGKKPEVKGRVKVFLSSWVTRVSYVNLRPGMLMKKNFTSHFLDLTASMK